MGLPFLLTSIFFSSFAFAKVIISQLEKSYLQIEN
jgi:hypothetical protein